MRICWTSSRARDPHPVGPSATSLTSGSLNRCQRQPDCKAEHVTSPGSHAPRLVAVAFGRRPLRFLQQVSLSPYGQRLRITAAQAVTAASEPVVFIPELVRYVHTLPSPVPVHGNRAWTIMSHAELDSHHLVPAVTSWHYGPTGRPHSGLTDAAALIGRGRANEAAQRLLHSCRRRRQ